MPKIDPSIDPMTIFAVLFILGIGGVMAMLYIMIVAWSRAVSARAEPDPCDGAACEMSANEPPTVNAWSAMHSGAELVTLPAPTPPLAPQPLSAGVALPKHHCPICVAITCEEWGIPLDDAHAVGDAVLCEKHKTTRFGAEIMERWYYLEHGAVS